MITMRSFLLFFIAFLPGIIQAQTSASSKTVPVIELTGSGYQRGLQHGTQLKKEIGEVYSKWKANIRRTTGGNPDSLLTAFRKSVNFEPITKQYHPSILEELKGIAAGSGQSYEDVYAFQLVDEFWIYLDKQANAGNHHCSGMGVAATANHPAYIAQNMDLENYMHGYQVLLHLAPAANEPEQYIVTCAGLVALAGMNAKGIALCMNTLMELNASEDGMPVAFIIRHVLSRQKGDEALQFLRMVKHASGQNYITGIADSVYNFEASSSIVSRFLPNPGKSNVVYHTNHALINDDVKPWYKKYHERVMAGTSNGNSEKRFASLVQRLDKQATDISTDLIKATLRSKDDILHPVCRTYRESGGGFTFSSIIFTLGGKRSVQLTYGSPELAEYKEYFFR
jgi:isopenicillin-N N-acyltransferase like protein